MVSDTSLPLSSVTRVCQTWVRLPLCSGVASARTLPERAAAKKLVFDSIVAVLWPGARLTAVPAAPIVSANAISVPPCSTPVVVSNSSRTASSATTRSFSVSRKRMPRCFTRPMFQSSSGIALLHLSSDALDAHVLLERRALARELCLQILVCLVALESGPAFDSIEHEMATVIDLDSATPQESRLAQHLGDVAAVEPAQHRRLVPGLDREAHDEKKVGLVHDRSSSG